MRRFHLPDRIERLAVLSAGILLLLGAPSYGQSRDAQAIPTRAQIERHLEAMYPIPTGNYIVKWMRPLRYQVSDHTRTIDKQTFQRKAAEFRQRFGIDIRESPDGILTNILFLFTNNVRAALRHPEIRAVFHQPGMSDEQYEKLIERAALDTGYGRYDADIRTKEIVKSVKIFDLNKLPLDRWESLVIGFIYATIAPTATSDVLRPSLANSNNLQRPDRLYPIDIAFLNALYSPAIEPGMPFAQAKPIMVDVMAAHLGAK